MNISPESVPKPLGIQGTTRLVGILGWPVEHSFSPRMHNAAFHALGLDFAYVPLAVPPERLGEAVQGLRALGFRGANVTIPHKEAVIPFLDGLSPLSQTMGTVNTLYWEGDKLMGTTTDPHGALANLAHAGFQPGAEAVALLGCGGAARAIAFGFAMEHPTTPLKVFARADDTAMAQKLVAELTAKTRANVTHGSLEQFRAEASDFALVINATPLGMHPFENSAAIDASILSPHQWVFDIVYNPRRTLLLQQAALRGCRTVEGLGMLLHQGARSFEYWTGVKPPLDVMAAALDRK